MPEPITIVAGAMSILASTLTSAKQVYTWIDGLQNAPGQIHDISQTIKIFERVLLRIQAIQLDPSDGHEILSVIETSRSTLSRIKERMEGLESEGKAKEGFWTRLSFEFKDTSLESMERRLAAHTALLQLFLLSTTQKNVGEIMRISRETLRTVQAEAKSEPDNIEVKNEESGLNETTLSNLLSIGSTKSPADNSMGTTEAVLSPEPHKQAQKLTETWYKETVAAKAFEKLAVEQSALMGRLRSSISRIFPGKLERLKEFSYDDQCPCAVRDSGAIFDSCLPSIHSQGDHPAGCYALSLVRLAEETGVLRPLPGIFINNEYHIMHGSEYTGETTRTSIADDVLEYSGTVTGLSMFNNWRRVATKKPFPFKHAFVLSTPPPIMPPHPQSPRRFPLLHRNQKSDKVFSVPDPMSPFRSAQSIKTAIDTIRNMDHFMKQDTTAREFLNTTLLVVSLGNPVSEEDYISLLELFGIGRSLTYYPATISILYRGLQLFIHRVKDETRHDLNEALRLIWDFYQKQLRYTYYGIVQIGICTWSTIWTVIYWLPAQLPGTIFPRL